jgi:hypothetical protein
MTFNDIIPRTEKEKKQEKKKQEKKLQRKREK